MHPLLIDEKQSQCTPEMVTTESFPLKHKNKYEIHVTRKYLIVCLTLCASLAFLTGWMVRIFLLEPRLTGRWRTTQQTDGEDCASSSSSSSSSCYSSYIPSISNSSKTKTNTSNNRNKLKTTMKKKIQLPRPILLEGKTMPETKYTSQIFDVYGKAVRTTHSLHICPPDVDVHQDENKLQERHVSFEDSINAAAAVAVASAASKATDSTNNIASKSPQAKKEENTREEEQLEEEEHLPQGQHLLVDIKNVDAAFLNSEERLARALIDVVQVSKLTLLSYHCHSLLPSGVSCVGVLLESHISFHTWPDEGVITLDLFTCGNEPLLPTLPVIERLFAIPSQEEGVGTYCSAPLLGGTGVWNSFNVTTGEAYRENNDEMGGVTEHHCGVEKPRMLWSHVLRGFRPRKERLSRLENDLYDYVLRPLQYDYKKEVASVQTMYQQIDIYDVIDPRLNSIRSFERSLRTDSDTYESHHPEFFRPNRMVFLDGVLQSTSQGDEACHEALVHPGMFVHEWPERVAIVGGGLGATLREVLKHYSVLNVTMVEIDEVMVQMSRKYLPEWHDCSDLEGSSGSCFDDERTELVYEDALEWFTNNFASDCDCQGDPKAKKKNCTCSTDGAEAMMSQERTDHRHGSKIGADDGYRDETDDALFDVIIMDSPNPQDSADFADILYKNRRFLESLHHALTKEGVFVMQLGMSPRLSDPAEHVSNQNMGQVLSILEELGFESIHVYEEPHCGFHSPSSFLVACKSYGCRYTWYSTEAQMQVMLADRLRLTRTGESPLRHFDSATMISYQIPPKAWENVFCQSKPTPDDCLLRGYNPDIVDYGPDAFEVKMSDFGEDAGRGIFSKVDIPKGSYIMQEHASMKIRFDQWTVELMEKMYEQMDDEKSDELEDVLRYMYGYGFQQKNVADYEYYVDSGIMAFANHGCNGTFNVEGQAAPSPSLDDPYFSEMTLDPERYGVLNPVRVTSTFNPAFARHLLHMAASFDVARRDIKAGEEILSNYLFFIADGHDWIEEVKDLQAQCRGELSGEVKKWEEEEDEDD